MTALERQMAADAVALSKEHADRADATEARWTALRAEIGQWRIAHYETAAGLEGEGMDGAPEASARADELGKVLDLMAEMED